MNKKIISITIAAAMGMSGYVPVMASGSITVAGEVLYSQNFEDEVESDFTTPVSASGGFTSSVYDYLGNKTLKLEGYTAYGYHKFGPSYSDAIVKADVMQLGASGNFGAYLGIGMRAPRISGGAYYSNMGAYFDVLWYNSDINYFDNIEGEQLRDTAAIVTEKGPDYTSKFDSYDAMETDIGILEYDQIFTESRPRAYERNFGGKFYRMQTSVIGSKATNSVKTEAGDVLSNVVADVVSSYAETGVSKLQAHSGIYLVDNIKVMAPAVISDFDVSMDSASTEVGSSTEFYLTSGNIKIEPDTARYDYDKSALNIDFANGTVEPLKTGTYTVRVYLDDIYGQGSISDSFTVTATEPTDKLEAVIADPNPAYGEATAITVYFGGDDVTDSAVYSGGVTYANGAITPTAYGLVDAQISYGGKTVHVPLAVNNTQETIGEKASQPAFTEDFEGDAEQLNAAYANGNSNITVESITNSNEGNTSNALMFNKIQASSAAFGPSDLTDYALEFDFYCPTPQGNSASFLGATMRANSTNGGYKVGYTPVMKYNEQTHKVDATLASATNSRQITAAYGPSNDMGKWYFGGFSGSSLQGTAMQGYWYKYSAQIKGDNISTSLTRRTNGALMASYDTTLTALAEGGTRDSGATVLSTSQNLVYFDNIKIYPIYSYDDIAVSYTEATGTASAFTVSGANAGGNGRLSGTVSASAVGDVTVSGNKIKPGEGLGYVTITYTDGFGVTKYKVIKTGSANSGAEAKEFTMVSDAKLYNQDGEELSAIVSNAPVYAQADIKKTAVGTSGVMMAVAVYNWDTGELVAVQAVTEDAIHRVGDTFRLYTKLVLPENEDGYLYAKVMVMTDGLVPIVLDPFEV